MRKELHIIVLAAGAGTRMKSSLPKVLHRLGGVPMIEHVLATAQALNPAQIHLVYGHCGDALREALGSAPVQWVLQAEQNGTGHAVAVALAGVPDDAQVLVLYGDAPLVRPDDLDGFDEHSVFTAELADPSGYGRIVRDGACVAEIVEHRDCNAQQRTIHEINSGMLATRAADLKRWLAAIRPDNSQGELYLTDAVALAAAEGRAFTARCLPESDSVKGANDMLQLAELEDIWQRRVLGALMRNGVRLHHPANTRVRGDLRCGRDVEIDTGAVFDGVNRLGDGVLIGAHSVLRDCDLAAGTRVAPHCVLEGVVTTGACDIGPFARLRPGTELSAGCKIGNFVETKKARLGPNSKASHLSYLGDAEIGANVNIGAGTITCNYDGVNKFTTEIGDGAFIGSDTQLIAPVVIGRNATIGAGSTISHDAPEEQLTLSRSRQKSVPDWQRPKKRS